MPAVFPDKHIPAFSLRACSPDFMQQPSDFQKTEARTERNLLRREAGDTRMPGTATSAHCWVTGCLWGLQAADPHPAPAHLWDGRALGTGGSACVTPSFMSSSIPNTARQEGLALKEKNIHGPFHCLKGCIRSLQQLMPTPEQGAVTEGPQQTVCCPVPAQPRLTESQSWKGWKEPLQII